MGDKGINDIKEKVKNFIFEEFTVANKKLDDNLPLFEAGLIDSLGMIKLMAFIEESFGVVINPSEVVIDNFDTIDKISRIISEKLLHKS